MEVLRPKGIWTKPQNICGTGQDLPLAEVRTQHVLLHSMLEGLLGQSVRDKVSVYFMLPVVAIIVFVVQLLSLKGRLNVKAIAKPQTWSSNLGFRLLCLLPLIFTAF